MNANQCSQESVGASAGRVLQCEFMQNVCIIVTIVQVLCEHGMQLLYCRHVQVAHAIMQK